PNGLKEILDYPTWLTQDDKINRFPLIEVSNWHSGIEKSAVLNFIKGNIQTFTPEVLASTRGLKNVVLWIDTDNEHAMAELRRLFFRIMQEQITHPVIVQRAYADNQGDAFPLYSATDVGG